MKHILAKLLIVPAALMLSGCASGTEGMISQTDSEAALATYDAALSESGDTSSASLSQESISDLDTSEADSAEDVTISVKTDDGYSIVLSYTLFDESDGVSEVSPASLRVVDDGGESVALSENVYLGESLSSVDHTVFSGEVRLEAVGMSGWNLAAVRVPSQDGEDTDKVTLFYTESDKLQLLGFHWFTPVIPENGVIAASADGESFSFTNADGGTEEYIVVYDEAEGAYCLRSADYSAEPIVVSCETSLGEISLSYTIYDRSDSGLVISAHNTVELTNNDGEVCSEAMASPVYQPAMTYDRLTSIASEMRLCVAELSDWGVAAVLVPYPTAAEYTDESCATLFYYDSDTIQLIALKDTRSDGELTADVENNRFSLTGKDGTVNWYTVVPDAMDESRMAIQAL